MKELFRPSHISALTLEPERFLGLYAVAWQALAERAAPYFAGGSPEPSILLSEQAIQERIGVTLPRISAEASTVERATLATELAERLVANPTRTMDIYDIIRDGAIVPQTAKSKTVPSFRRIQGNVDAVCFTFGLPYINNAYHDKPRDNREQCIGTVILNGPSLLTRPDLQTTYFDRGFLFHRIQPFAPFLDQFPAIMREYRHTPLAMLYDYMLAEPIRTRQFTFLMGNLLRRYRLSPEDIMETVGRRLTRSYPLFNAEADAALVPSWREIYMPEGNVTGRIGTEEITAIVVPHENYPTISRAIGQRVPILQAGPEKSDVSARANQLIAYLDFIGADKQIIEGQQHHYRLNL